MPTATVEPVSLLIADFANLTKDVALEGSLEGALGIAIEGAPFITAYSRLDARKIAADITKRPVVDEVAARLVAAREGIKVVLAGTVSSEGGQYRIVVKGQYADGTALWTQQRTARKRTDLLGAVAGVASDIRSALGDTESIQRHVADAESVTTSSLEALQGYTRAQEEYSAGRFEEARRLFEESIAQDATFGRAYAGLANTFFYMGRKNEAIENWNKALSLMDA